MDISLANSGATTPEPENGALPRGILRAPHIQAVPKQLSFDICPSPAPSAKSSCISHSDSYHMFERPRLRGSHRRKDPSRFRLETLQQRSNSESMFRMSPPWIEIPVAGRRMSMAYLPSRDQALLRKILGPRGLSWIDSNRKRSVAESSRKSVSIAYSNDLEAQKHCDDSETPLMNEKEDNSGGRLIKREQLHEKRRLMCDRALTFAIIGIGKLFMNANAADDWRVSLTARRVVQIMLELFVCALCPLPLELGKWGRDKNNTKMLHSLNIMLSIIMFARLYWLCRVMLLHSRLFTDASSRSIAGLNRVNFNARFILKTLMTLCPGTVLMIFTASLWIMAGWILRLCEREYISVDRRKDVDYISSIWLVAITFLSVGYGDIVPHTTCGRTMAVVTGILGTCTSSMVVAVIARKLELTRAEKHVHNFMMDTQLTKQLKHSAANVLRETWLIYKFRKKIEKPDYTRVRQHQRKFLVAIYELRKVKRDQRKLAENLVSLGDVAKTSSNTYELVHDVHSTQEGLSLRITAIEHQLGDISREIGMLAELIRGRRHSQMSVSEADTSPVHVTRRRKHGELLE